MGMRILEEYEFRENLIKVLNRIANSIEAIAKVKVEYAEKMRKMPIEVIYAPGRTHDDNCNIFREDELKKKAP